MVFQYQVWGSSGVMLRVWREASQEHKALWVIAEDQGKEWREGRIILPSYDMEYSKSAESSYGVDTLLLYFGHTSQEQNDGRSFCSLVLRLF